MSKLLGSAYAIRTQITESVIRAGERLNAHIDSEALATAAADIAHKMNSLETVQESLGTLTPSEVAAAIRRAARLLAQEGKRFDSRHSGSKATGTKADGDENQAVIDAVLDSFENALSQNRQAVISTGQSLTRLEDVAVKVNPFSARFANDNEWEPHFLLREQYVGLAAELKAAA